MAYLEDTFGEDERRRLEREGTAGGAAPMSTGGAGAVQSQPQAPTAGFANLANYFTANKDTAEAQGAETAATLQKSAEEALRSDSPGQAIDVAGQLDAAQTPGGLAATLKQDDPQYTAGMAGLDAYLGTKGSEPGQFEGLRSLFHDRLGKVETRPENPFPSFKELFPGGVRGGLSQAGWDQAQPKIQSLLDWIERRRENVAPGTKTDKNALWANIYGMALHGEPWGAVGEPYEPGLGPPLGPGQLSDIWKEVGLTIPNYWKGEG